MSVQIVKYEMDVPKEFKDVVDLMDGLLEKVMAKEKLTSFIELYDELKEAVDNIGGIKEEAKSQFRDEAVAYLVHKMMSRLMPVKEIVADPEPATDPAA